MYLMDLINRIVKNLLIILMIILVFYLHYRFLVYVLVLKFLKQKKIQVSQKMENSMAIKVGYGMVIYIRLG